MCQKMGLSVCFVTDEDVSSCSFSSKFSVVASLSFAKASVDCLKMMQYLHLEICLGFHWQLDLDNRLGCAVLGVIQLNCLLCGVFMKTDLFVGLRAAYILKRCSWNSRFVCVVNVYMFLWIKAGRFSFSVCSRDLVLRHIAHIGFLLELQVDNRSIWWICVLFISNNRRNKDAPPPPIWQHTYRNLTELLFGCRLKGVCSRWAEGTRPCQLEGL